MLRKDVIVEKDKKIAIFLQDYGFSYSDANKMLRNKDVKIDGKATKDNITVHAGSVVTFFYTASMLEKKYEIVYETDEAYVIYKYAGIESCGEKGIEGVLKKSIAVHRLDRNTEGLMVYAKTQEVAEKLKKAFKKHTVTKCYVTEVVGKIDVDKVFSAYLLKDSKNALVKIYDGPTDGAVLIQTRIRTIKSTNESSLLLVELISGRTHQIRAHLAHLGHPIIGDGKYGKNETNKKFQENKQKLACFRLKFGFLGVKTLDFKEFEHKPSWAKDFDIN